MGCSFMGSFRLGSGGNAFRGTIKGSFRVSFKGVWVRVWLVLLVVGEGVGSMWVGSGSAHCSLSLLMCGVVEVAVVGVAVVEVGFGSNKKFRDYRHC